MDRDLAARYGELYRRHWWWRAREAMLVDVIGALPLPASARILDVGCGDGLFFDRLGAFGEVRGIEVDESLLTPDGPHRERISTRPLGASEYAGSAFHLITALDAIEHMEDDSTAVRDMVAMLSPGGWLVITVPAFMLLWDRHDEINHHYRRYTRATLRRLLEPHGEIRRLRYAFAGLFVPKLAAKGLGRLRGGGLVQDVIPSAPLNRVLAAYFRIENRITGRLGAPFGTSLLALLQTGGAQ